MLCGGALDTCRGPWAPPLFPSFPERNPTHTNKPTHPPAYRPTQDSSPIFVEEVDPDYADRPAPPNVKQEYYDFDGRDDSYLEDEGALLLNRVFGPRVVCMCICTGKGVPPAVVVCFSGGLPVLPTHRIRLTGFEYQSIKSNQIIQQRRTWRTWRSRSWTSSTGARPTRS